MSKETVTHTVAEVAKITGRSESTIRRRLRSSGATGIPGALRTGPNGSWQIPQDGLVASGLLDVATQDIDRPNAEAATSISPWFARHGIEPVRQGGAERTAHLYFPSYDPPEDVTLRTYQQLGVVEATRRRSQKYVVVWFSRPIEGLDPDAGHSFASNCHKVDAVWASQNARRTVFIDDLGATVAAWPTRLIRTITWPRIVLPGSGRTVRTMSSG